MTINKALLALAMGFALAACSNADQAQSSAEGAADAAADAQAAANETTDPALAGTAQAAGSSMPWEGPLQSILESIQGPVARIIAVIIIIATGLALAFGDTSGGFRKLIQIVFGLSIAFAASSFFLSFFSFSGGAVV